MHSYIQRLTSVHFIFSGSQRHVLENMFASASRPFYQSTQTMPLAEIPCVSYFSFAKAKLNAHKQDIDEQAFGFLLSYMGIRGIFKAFLTGYTRQERMSQRI